ncbi:MAG: hypothetical protein ACJ763_17450 [Bdellovibrionia bacterium]
MKSKILIVPLIPLWACTLTLQSCSSSKNDSPSLPANTTQSIYQSMRPGDLVRAAANGDENKVRQLLQSGADVNETVTVTVPSHGNIEAHSEAVTPLLAAVAMNYESIASLLINYQAKSANSFQPNFQGFTAKDFLLYRGQNATASLLR